MIVGVAMLSIAVFGLTSNGDDSSTTSERTAPERPITPGSSQAPSPGAGTQKPSTTAQGGAIGLNLARRQPVKAPGFSAKVIHGGSLPQALQEPFKRSTDGGRLDLSKLDGTPVVLHLFSSQCAPCRADSRLVEASWKRWGPRGVLFVGASVKDSPSAAERLMQQYKLTYPAVLDSGGEIAGRYGATALPQTFFISGDGDIVGEVVGSPSVRQLELGSEAADSGKPFGSEQGSSRVPLG